MGARAGPGRRRGSRTAATTTRSSRSRGPARASSCRARRRRTRATCRTTVSATTAARRARARLPDGIHRRRRFEIYLRAGHRGAVLRAPSRPRARRGRAAVRARRARHAPTRGEDGALRQRHRRHGHARGRRTSAGSSRWARATSSGATRSRGRRPRASRASSSDSRWWTAGSPATAIPRAPARGGRRHVRHALADPGQPIGLACCRRRTLRSGPAFEVDIRGRGGEGAGRPDPVLQAGEGLRRRA